jgi:hypothetical protein
MGILDSHVLNADYVSVAAGSFLTAPLRGVRNLQGRGAKLFRLPALEISKAAERTRRWLARLR